MKKVLTSFLLSALSEALRSPTRLFPIDHGKPWTGPEQKKDDQTLKISGSTGWQVFQSGDTELWTHEVIVTLESEKDWTTADKPQWFLAIPSDIDDIEGGVRDYIIIKSVYSQGTVDSGTSTAGGFNSVDDFYQQDIEYFQSRNPTFTPTDGVFTFTDNGGIRSTQLAQKDPDRLVATNGLDAQVWAVANAAFTSNKVQISFTLKTQDKLTIPSIPMKKKGKVGIAMAL